MPIQRPASGSGPKAGVAAPSLRPLLLPLAWTILLMALGFLPAIQHQTVVRWSFWGAGVALLVWNAVMFVTAGAGRSPTIDVVLRSQHYVQACAHLSILTYWGWYWREVYDAAPLIVAQLVFAYACDSLLLVAARHLHAWLWTLSDHFQHQPVSLVQAGMVLPQFLIVAMGFAAKELIRWNKEGRRSTSSTPRHFRSLSFSIASAHDRHHAHDMGARRLRQRSSIRRNLPAIFLVACQDSSCLASHR